MIPSSPNDIIFIMTRVACLYIFSTYDNGIICYLSKTSFFFFFVFVKTKTCEIVICSVTLGYKY